MIEPVQTAEFDATLIVPVPKPNGAVRICGDFKITVNKYADMQHYPLPHPEELRAALVGGKIFSKVDLADAYLQLEVDTESRKYLVLSTHKGLFRYTASVWLSWGACNFPERHRLNSSGIARCRGVPRRYIGDRQL